MKYILLLALCSCSAFPVVRDVGPVRIHAVNGDLADCVASAVGPALDVVSRLPGSDVSARANVYVREAREGVSTGLTCRDWIELRIDPALQAVAWRGTGLLVAHEFAHYYLPEAWRGLPIVIEEGLVDIVAQSAEPAAGRVRRRKYDQLVLVASADPVVWSGVLQQLAVSREEFLLLPVERRELLTAVGCLIVERVGLDRLQGVSDVARAILASDL